MSTASRYLESPPHSPSLSSLPSRIASLVLSRFDALPRKAKPRAGEWIPLSGIVIVKGKGGPVGGNKGGLLMVGTSVGLGLMFSLMKSTRTGTKTLPRSTISVARGRILHDSHAEILALRALNYFFLQEIERIVSTNSPSVESSRAGTYVSPFLERTEEDKGPRIFSLSASSKRKARGRPFKLRNGLTVHLFSTEPPCGDASMESLIKARCLEGRVPWTRPPETMAGDEEVVQGGSRYAGSHLQGRGYFSELGVVRRKPARGDAEVSWSKSCSDKLAVRECLGVLNATVDALIETVWLQSLVLPLGKGDENAMKRAFGKDGRLSDLQGRQMPGHYNFRPFGVEILPTGSPQFPFAKPKNERSKAGNVTSIWIVGRAGKGTEASEVLINGVKQGWRQNSEDFRKASVVCRENVWRKGRKVVEFLRGLDGYEMIAEDLQRLLSLRSYAELKGSLLQSRRAHAKKLVIDILGHWYPNRGDEGWGLESPDHIQVLG